MIKVEDLLTNYQEQKRTLGLLNFRINYFSGLSGDHVIEELTFTTPEGERVTTSGVSDKTSRIALAYHNTSYEQGKEILEELIRRYQILKSELDLLDYCMTLLDKELSDITIDLFVNEMLRDEVCDKYNISLATMKRYRRRALEELAKMFDDVMCSKKLEAG